MSRVLAKTKSRFPFIEGSIGGAVVVQIMAYCAREQPTNGLSMSPVAGEPGEAATGHAAASPKNRVANPQLYHSRRVDYGIVDGPPKQIDGAK